jgi:hypothetical protein
MATASKMNMRIEPSVVRGSSIVRCGIHRCNAELSFAIAPRSGTPAPAAPSSSGGRQRPAADAHHAGTERRHSDVIRPAIGAEHRLVVAVPARHVERPDAELAHVAERHRLDLVANAARQRREPAIALRPASGIRRCGSFSFFVPTVSRCAVAYPTRTKPCSISNEKPRATAVDRA